MEVTFTDMVSEGLTQVLVGQRNGAEVHELVSYSFNLLMKLGYDLFMFLLFNRFTFTSLHNPKPGLGPDSVWVQCEVRVSGPVQD